MNLAPCGDNDGGLVVLKGGHEVSAEYHDVFRNEERGFRWTNEVSRSAGYLGHDADHGLSDVCVQGHRLEVAPGTWLRMGQGQLRARRPCSL